MKGTKKDPVKCGRCGLIRKQHVGMESFCPEDEKGRTFVYNSSKPRKPDKKEAQDPEIVLAVDTDTRKVGCVLIQAALGGQYQGLGLAYHGVAWEVNMTPGMRLVKGLRSQWLRLLENHPR